MKARGEILKQVQDDGVITVTRFVTVPHKCSAGSPRKKTFSSKDPEQKLASESLQKQNPVPEHPEGDRIIRKRVLGHPEGNGFVRKHLFEHLEGNRFFRKYIFEHPEDRRIVRRPVGQYHVDGGFVR